MRRPVPQSALWLAGRFVPSELAEDVAGEIEERFHADCERSAVRAWLRAHTLGAAVAWHALRDRARPAHQEVPTGGSSMFNAFSRELSFAVRHWRGRPGLALTAILILAIGIGSTTAIFSIVDAVVLRQLPWYDPERLVSVYVARPHWKSDPVLGANWSTGNLSWVIFKDLQGKSKTLAGMGVWQSDRLTLNGEPSEPVEVMNVSASLLPMLGVTPYEGRFFTVEEDESPSDSALVSFEAWTRRYGARPDIIGQSISINETRYRIVGVVPSGFRFGTTEPAEFMLPIGRTPAQQRNEGNHFLNGVGRLAAGATVAQAAQEVDPWIRGNEPAAEKAASLVPLAADQSEPARKPLFTLLAAAGLLLLIAASNVAALLQGAAATRRHELAIRVALGGGRRQVTRQLFLESLILGGCSALLGVVLAIWLTPVLVSMAPSTFARLDTVAIDLRVLTFAVVLTLGTTLLFGMGPAWSMSRANPADALRAGGRTGTVRAVRGTRWVVTAQVSLSLVLLMGAGLLAETVRRLTSQPVGFDAAPLVVTSVRLPPIVGGTGAQRAVRTQAIVDRLSRLPGVEAATAANAAPFSGIAGSSSFQVPGKTFARNPSANRHIVSQSYFHTMGIRPMKGRLFDDTDAFGAHAAVITDEFERRILDGDAVGKHFVLNGDDHTVIGVIPAPKYKRFSEEPPVAFYMLSRQLPQWPTPGFIVRASGSPAELLPTVRKAIAEAEPQVSFITLETMAAMQGRSVAEERYRAQLAVGFAGSALLLAGIGLYGLLARSIRDQRREMGVRLALGAAPREVRRLVMSKALGLVALGLIPGIPAALAAGRAIGSFLYGVTPLSPLVLIGATAIVVFMAMLAALGPALRAARIDPIETLRD